MIKQAIIFVFIACSLGLFAQQPFSYYVNNDTLPAGITQTSTSKARREIKDENRNQRRAVRRAAREFYYDSNFALDNFLYNGRVIFNKEFNDYINKVADVLFKNEPLVRSKLKFYLVSSPDVNAFADHEGSVFITSGLMARLNTEAQLAAVLSHEAVHFVMRHSLVGHIEEFKIDQGISTYGREIGSQMLAKHSFSRLQESESDYFGFKTFYKTGYKINAPIEVFEILKTSGEPYFGGSFDQDHLKIGQAQMPAEWFKVPYIDPKRLPEETDERSTHPALSKRIDTLRRVMRTMKLDTMSGKDFIVSAGKFAEIKQQSERYVCNLHIVEHEYSSAIYHISTLLKKYPNDPYLRSELARAFYVYCYTQKPATVATVITINGEGAPSNADSSGVIRQVRAFLRQFKRSELGLLALITNFDAQSSQKEGRVYLADCMRMLVLDQHMELEKLGLKLNGTTPQKDSTLVPDTSFASAVFQNTFQNDIMRVFGNADVQEMYRKNIEKSKTITSVEGGLGFDESEFRTRTVVYDSSFMTAGDHLIILDPVYYSVDMRSGEDDDDKVDMVLSEKKELQLLKQVKHSARSFKTREVLLYDWKSMNQSDIAKYDQLAILNEWHLDYLNSDRPLSINEWKKDQLISKLQSRYMVEFVFVGIKMRKETLPVIAQIYRPLILPLWLPDAITQIAKPREHTYMLVKVYDLETNKLVYLETKAMVNIRPQPSVIGGLVHNTILKTFNGKLVKRKKK